MTSTPDPHRPVAPVPPDAAREAESAVEAEIGRVKEPARLLRVSTMARSLLDEARGLPLDEHAREQLGHIHARVVAEIGDSVAPELREELERLLPTSSGTLTQGGRSVSRRASSWDGWKGCSRASGWGCRSSRPPIPSSPALLPSQAARPPPPAPALTSRAGDLWSSGTGGSGGR
ncbi:hypothetical protein GCM10020001_077490 [Nonomuraea salmonea]